MDVQGRFDLGILSNSESPTFVDIGKQQTGLSSVGKRGTTQREVKVPKYWLSVLKISPTEDSEEVGLEAATLEGKRNSSLTEVVGFEDVRD